MLKHFYFLAGLSFFLFLLHSCKNTEQIRPVNFDPQAIPFKTLSEYAFFKGNMATLKPNEGVLPYDLNTPLFSDYAYKARFVWMPDSLQATVASDGSIDFPEHTVLIKNFYYPEDFRKDAENWNLVETRLLVKGKETWEAFTYIWSEDQKEARLSLVGGFQEIDWTNPAGQAQQVNYLIPNKNQCKSCHNTDNKIMPIGPKVSNLSRTFEYMDGPQEQLVKWQESGILEASNLLPQFSPLPVWDDPQSGDLESRALAYLDVNCGHCHHPAGPAHTTGMYLNSPPIARDKLGICKSPVAAGKGSGDRKFGISPGQPDSSILVFRMESTDPGIMMPELGRAIKHQEGIQLIREWIGSLEGNCQ